MKLIEGNSATSRRKYSYRGHFIWSVARRGDARNKTNSGYDWHVELADGQIRNPVGGKRADAKQFIDQLVGGAE
jgi:hypothetical protein